MSGLPVVLRDVCRRFGASEVLREISFELAAGELVALSGPSGSGKTTLLQLIGSLDRPTAGRILVGDVDVGSLVHPALFRRTTVGFVFQLHHLMPSLTVRQNVELPMAAAHLPRRRRAQRALELLAEVGLDDRADAVPADLSGGERQRVAIARALVNDPPLILADEPTGSLDSVASRRIWELLIDARNRRGATVIIASHDPSLQEHVDRVLHLLDGRLVGVAAGGADGAGAHSEEAVRSALRSGTHSDLEAGGDPPDPRRCAGEGRSR
jgi:ABC-type lipoprotein export system ATPase subunit